MINPELEPFLKVWNEAWSVLPQGASPRERRILFEYIADDMALHELEDRLGNRPVDLVLSDMAPNFSGVATVDQARSMVLAEMALDFACAHLRRGGAYLVKLFQGTEFDQYVKVLRTKFDKVNLRKPKASRDRSREVYALATGFKV